MDNKQTNNTQTPEVTAKITWLNDDPQANKRASANITIGKCFTVHGLSIINSSKGLFVAMPQKVKTDNGESKYYDVAHPVTAPMRQLISDKVIDAYNEMIAKQGQNQKTEISNSDQPVETSGNDEAEEVGIESNTGQDQEEDSVPVMSQTM